MSVKFKLGFTINAETLFMLMSKMLPIEDLSVEEVVERPATQPTLANNTYINQLTGKTDYKNKKPKGKYLRRHHGPNLKAGINGVITTHLSDGMGHPLNEFRKPLKAAGYSESSVSSRMEELRKRGVVENLGDGTWRLTNKYLIANASPPSATAEAGPK